MHAQGADGVEHRKDHHADVGENAHPHIGKAEGDEQQKKWNECFDIIAEEAPIYALFHRQTGTGWQESMITGFEPIGTTGLVFLGASATA